MGSLSRDYNENVRHIKEQQQPLQLHRMRNEKKKMRTAQHGTAHTGRHTEIKSKCMRYLYAL